MELMLRKPGQPGPRGGPVHFPWCTYENELLKVWSPQEKTSMESPWKPWRKGMNRVPGDSPKALKVGDDSKHKLS